MAQRLPGNEEYYRCSICGFPCDASKTEEGDYGSSGWDFFDGDTSGSNLVSNPGFADTTGWTGQDATLAAVGSGQSGNCLQITRTGATEQYAYTTLSDLISGALYRARAYVKTGSSGDEAYIIRAMDENRTGTYNSVSGTSSNTWTISSPLYWRPTGTTTILCLVKNTSTAGTMLFDTVDAYLFYYKVKENLPGCPFCGSKNWR